MLPTGLANRLDLRARLDFSPPQRSGPHEAEMFNLDAIEQSNRSRTQ